MTIVVAMVVLSWPSGMSGNLMPTFPSLAYLAIVAAVTVLGCGSIMIPARLAMRSWPANMLSSRE
jgi:putative ABC transport system permease protein